MLEELEAVELLKSEALKDNASFRFDAEYFKKAYLKIEESLHRKGFQYLTEYNPSITGGATPLGAEYSTEGIPFLRVQNIMQNYFNDSDLAYITDKQNTEILRSSLKKEDVLLTITGVSYGKSCIVTDQFVGSNINQHSVRIRTKKLNPYFLATFLNSFYGKSQSDKYVVGVTRPAL
ncbi:MAG: restriction endonuclease subunit S, partial [Vampirovibrionales bacterium]